VLAVRGDDNGFPKPERKDRTKNEYASDLVAQIVEMNNGNFQEELIDAAPTDFCIGAGGYPEKHEDAPNMTWDILNLKHKVDAGADYIVTQMFFDNRHYFEFVEKCREVGITVPIVPGLKIVITKAHLHSLPRTFHAEIPEALAAEIEAAKPKHVAEIGENWARQQSEELLSANVPGLHFYIMTTADHVCGVVEPLRKMA
jgi:methylenetetrahydrofolate reductase (NADPH)